MFHVAKPLLKIDKKQANLSLLLLIGLALPFTYVHEFGHALYCWSQGVEIIKVGFGETTCAFNSEDILYYAFGGVFAAIIAAAPLAMKRIRNNKGVLVALLTLSLYNAYNAGIETVNHSTYVTLVQGWNLTFALSNALMFLGVYFTMFFKFFISRNSSSIGNSS